ncbi:hypothetical protein GCM10027598_83100 [Amycolatopsis oliviviridis]|uniref:Serine/threonine protein kinase n=1 Tax=Amycolatopsis oliviviridis TaxID=1471590 RepID=A0ABQ3L8X5_9PSEU|nr:hypothetical protein [Amycolatopsis oliviviridis]GHH06876.1 hypothetical protein GCM10017790_13000 [Amycolatopsis oliviviridis]
MTNNDRAQSKTARAGTGKHSDPSVTAAHVTRRGAILAAVITAVIGAVATVVVALINSGAQPAKGAEDRGAPATPGSSSQAAAVAPQQQSTPGEAVPEQVKLDAKTGVDLDGPNVVPVSTTGPNGDIDLYYDGGNLTSNRKGLFYYYGTEKEAKEQCPKVVSEGKDAVPGPQVIFAGGQQCLRTSKGTAGWISVNDVKIDDNSGYMVINYKVFR